MVVTFHDLINPLDKADDSEVIGFLGHVVRDWLVAHPDDVRHVLHWLAFVKPEDAIQAMLNEGIHQLSIDADMEERLAREDDVA